MNEQERIESIKANGGLHLRTFKEGNITIAMSKTAVALNGEAIYYVPVEQRSDELFRIACKTYGQALRLVPEERRSYEICQIAVAADGMALQFVPTQLRDKGLCLAAVKNTESGQAIAYVPDQLLTPDFYKEAATAKGPFVIFHLPSTKQNNKFYSSIIEVIPDIIYGLPKKSRTAAICRKAIKGMGFSSTADAIKKAPELFSYLHPSLYDHDSSLAFIQSDFYKNLFHSSRRSRFKEDYEEAVDSKEKYEVEISENLVPMDKVLTSYDVCLEAVKIVGSDIDLVPVDLIDQKMCDAAVRSGAYASGFAYIPDKFKTRELCDYAVEKDPWNLMDVPDTLKTSEMCISAVIKDDSMLEFVPEPLKTYEMCTHAVSIKGENLRYVPCSLIDKTLVLLAVSNVTWLHYVLDWIPVQLRDYEMYLTAVKTFGFNLSNVPDTFKDYALCFAAAQQTSDAAPFIPADYFDENMLSALIHNHFYKLDTIPVSCLTPEICNEAFYLNLHNGGTILRNIPEEFRSPEICLSAIQADVNDIRYIPENLVTKEMLMIVADKAPSLLNIYFPARYTTDQEFLAEIIRRYPRAQRSVELIVEKTNHS